MQNTTTPVLPDNYKPRDLMDLLEIEGYKDPVWQTFRYHFAPKQIPYHVKKHNRFYDWKQPTYSGKPQRLTQKEIMMMLLQIPFRTWISAHRLYQGLGTTLTFDLENSFSDKFAISRDYEIDMNGMAQDRTLHLVEALGDIPHLVVLSGGKGVHVHVFPSEPFPVYESMNLHGIVLHELEKGGAEVIPRTKKHFCRMPFGSGSGIVQNLDQWRELKERDRVELSDFQVWTTTTINDGVSITDPRKNLRILYDFIEQHKSDAPTVQQVTTRLWEKWLPKTLLQIPKGPLPPIPTAPSAGKSDAQTWEDGASRCESSNEASMVGVRHCLRQDMDYDDTKEAVWEWLQTTGYEFDQVQSGSAYNKLDGIVRNCEIGKRQTAPSAQPQPPGFPVPPPKNADLLSPVEQSTIEQKVHSDDLPAALAVARFIRQVQTDNGLLPHSPVAIYSKLWRKFPGCNKNYKAVQLRLIERGIIKVVSKHSAGNRSTTFSLLVSPS